MVTVEQADWMRGMSRNYTQSALTPLHHQAYGYCRSSLEPHPVRSSFRTNFFFQHANRNPGSRANSHVTNGLCIIHIPEYHSSKTLWERAESHCCEQISGAMSQHHEGICWSTKVCEDCMRGVESQ